MFLRHYLFYKTSYDSKGWFDFIILIFIACNCITLAMERPNIPPWSTERAALDAMNHVFTVVFGVEMYLKVRTVIYNHFLIYIMLKIRFSKNKKQNSIIVIFTFCAFQAVATGLFYGEHAYFKSGWNIMDGSLVLISVIDTSMTVIFGQESKIFDILRVFRLVRALRPLRVINRAPGLKLVVQTLLSSLKPIGNIVLICCTFFIIFGILGVQASSLSTKHIVYGSWMCRYKLMHPCISIKYTYCELQYSTCNLQIKL